MKAVSLKSGLVIVLLLRFLPLSADELHLAVAANFGEPARQLAAAFDQQSGHRTIVSTGSTGKLYAHIINGAPYDVFLAADNRRPGLLEQRGLVEAGGRFTYAIGRLALWSREARYITPAGLPDPAGFAHLAIANPRLAPYGEAARETLKKLGRWDAVKAKIVRGESIGQTYQFVASGNARLGFIAVSQLPANQGSFWRVPQHMHKPIEQQAVILNNSPAATAFAAFLRQPASQQLIRDNGYDVDKD